MIKNKSNNYLIPSKNDLMHIDSKLYIKCPLNYKFKILL